MSIFFCLTTLEVVQLIPPVGTHDYSFIHSKTVYVFWGFIFNEGSSVLSKLLLALASTVIHGFGTLETHDHIFLSHDSD
jgi:hypothetical protein